MHSVLSASQSNEKQKQKISYIYVFFYLVKITFFWRPCFLLCQNTPTPHTHIKIIFDSKIYLLYLPYTSRPVYFTNYQNSLNVILKELCQRREVSLASSETKPKRYNHIYQNMQRMKKVNVWSSPVFMTPALH